ncbi:MAG TPA: hypothetical protein VJT13_14285 [Xanthobacteraceae bacterium]|nr:hypothetical protein [Xanthobacteraceae bacterium]
MDKQEDLAIEVAALRLIVRSIVAQMLLLSSAPLTKTLKAFEEAVAKMSPDEVPIADLDPEVHRQAAELAKKRAQQFVRDIGRMIGPGASRGPSQRPRQAGPSSA